MIIRHLSIENFRGIKTLEWKPNAGLNCLVGPGDSAKTTILDAIELGLSPRWNEGFDDVEFYKADVSNPVKIIVTVAGVPDKLLIESKFGRFKRGWTDEGEIRDEPDDDDEVVLSVRLIVDESLEPQWHVVTDRPGGEVRISHLDRERLGVARLGAYIDRHLSWSRGSALSGLTDDKDNLPGVLADAGRQTRKAIAGAALTGPEGAATKAQVLAEAVGVSPADSFVPGLDTQRISISQGAVSLHDGEIPVRRAGLGTRRLVTFAIQSELMNRGSALLIDEIEHGLEPHRIRRLLDLLRERSEKGTEEQIILTTHSPVVVVELDAGMLWTVGNIEGTVTLSSTDDDLQDILRAAPEAFLGKRVLVCEGRTEVGFLRALDQCWVGQGDKSFGYHGVVPVDGGGSSAEVRARNLANQGYTVAYLCDSDVDLKDKPALTSAGVKVVQWDDGLAIEQRIARDLPWDGLLEVIALAEETWSEASVHSTVSTWYQPGLSFGSASWQDSSQLREAIGKAAMGKRKNGEKSGSKSWFKTIGLGQKLGELVAQDHLGRRAAWAPETEADQFSGGTTREKAPNTVCAGPHYVLRAGVFGVVLAFEAVEGLLGPGLEAQTAGD